MREVLVAFDCGLNNMGMACLEYTSLRSNPKPEDWKVRVLAADLRGLPPQAKKSTPLLVEAIHVYLDCVLGEDTGSSATGSTATGSTATGSSATGSSSPRIVPTCVIVEQQHISTRVGSNFKTKEIEVAIYAACRERFPLCRLHAKAASARNSGGTKERAKMLGEMVILDYAPREIVMAFTLCSDRQHTSDAITMIVDYMKFAGMASIRERLGAAL